MNERNEIMGDWYEEMNLELERIDMYENGPTLEMSEEDYERWHQVLQSKGCTRANESWIRCPDCQEEH